MLCLEVNKIQFGWKLWRKLKMKRNYQMHCLFRSIVGNVKMIPFMSHTTDTMPILGHKMFYRSSMSIRMDNVEYIMTQKDHKCRYQKCDFHLSTPFRIWLSYSEHKTRCKEYFADLRTVLVVYLSVPFLLKSSYRLCPLMYIKMLELYAPPPPFNKFNMWDQDTPDFMEISSYPCNCIYIYNKSH